MRSLKSPYRKGWCWINYSSHPTPFLPQRGFIHAGSRAACSGCWWCRMSESFLQRGSRWDTSRCKTSPGEGQAALLWAPQPLQQHPSCINSFKDSLCFLFSCNNLEPHPRSIHFTSSPTPPGLHPLPCLHVQWCCRGHTLRRSAASLWPWCCRGNAGVASFSFWRTTETRRRTREKVWAERTL